MLNAYFVGAGVRGSASLRLEVRDMFLRFFSRLEVFSYPRTSVPPFPRKVPPQWGEARRGLQREKNPAYATLKFSAGSLLYPLFRNRCVYSALITISFTGM